MSWHLPFCSTSRRRGSTSAPVAAPGIASSISSFRMVQCEGFEISQNTSPSMFHSISNNRALQKPHPYTAASPPGRGPYGASFPPQATPSRQQQCSTARFSSRALERRPTHDIGGSLPPTQPVFGAPILVFSAFVENVICIHPKSKALFLTNGNFPTGQRNPEHSPLEPFPSYPAGLGQALVSASSLIAIRKSGMVIRALHWAGVGYEL